MRVGLIGVLALTVGVAAPAGAQLTASDVEKIIGRAVAAARRIDFAVNVVVVDHEGNILGAHSMPGARGFTRLVGGGTNGQGAEGLCVPADPAAPFDAASCPPASLLFNGAMAAAIS